METSCPTLANQGLQSSAHPHQPLAGGRLPVGRAAGHAAAGTPEHRAAQRLLRHRGGRATGGRPGGRTALLIEQSIGGRLQLPIVRLQGSLQGKTVRWVCRVESAQSLD